MKTANNIAEKTRRLTIYDIKRLTVETNPYFFSRQSMKFFNQTLASFSVHKQKDGKYLITAPMFDNTGKQVGYTKKVFDPANNELATPI